MNEQPQQQNLTLQEEIKLDLQTLDKLRRKKEGLAKAYENAMAEFKDLNQLLLISIENVRTQTQSTEENLRNLGLKEYAETGEKKLTGGLSIRILKKLEYDEKEALVWAKDHDIAVQLDKKAFEELAKKTSAIEQMGFVTIKEEPKTTIPTKIEA